jgi:HTH-type transcriptional regulator / antitoxin HipB
MDSQSVAQITSVEVMGKLLRLRRQALKISQQDLASLTGVDQSNLSRIEHGKIPATLETYLRLLNALGVDLQGVVRG